jgi:hypothetical protein
MSTAVSNSSSIIERVFRRDVLCLLIVFSSSCGGHISDSSLRNTFGKHEAAFNELRDMFASDKKFRHIARDLIATDAVMVSSSSPSDLNRVGLAPARFAQYLKLFDMLGLENGIGRSEYGIWFHTETPSFGNGDSSKGFIYSTLELQPIVTNLDAYVPMRDRRRGVSFSPIKPHWYLFKQLL